MKFPATIVRLASVLLALASTPLFSQTAHDQEVSQIVAKSQESLQDHNEQKALSLIQEGLIKFPNDEELRIQLARIYVEQKRDRQAIGLLNSILMANPASRNAKLELAQIFGYRENYKESDRLYRELLTANADDEAAALGLVHNLALEGKRAEARAQLQQAFARHPTSLQLQQYSDYLASEPVEGQARKIHRVQNSESFVTDTSGNRSVYSNQGMVYQFSKNFTGRMRLEETSLWKTGTFTETVLSGVGETRLRLGKYAAVRTSLGAVRFADTSSQLLYGGDLELYSFKGLAVSGGFVRCRVSPTFDSTACDLLAQRWHSHLDYRGRNFCVTRSL